MPLYNFGQSCGRKPVNPINAVTSFFVTCVLTLSAIPQPTTLLPLALPDEAFGTTCCQFNTGLSLKQLFQSECMLSSNNCRHPGDPQANPKASDESSSGIHDHKGLFN